MKGPNYYGDGLGMYSRGPAYLLRRTLMGVVIVVMVLTVAVLYLFGRERAAPEEMAGADWEVPTVQADDLYGTFQTVRNECGSCGTDSPVGGWEAEDERSLVLAENGSFRAFFGDGTSMAGTWFVGATRLCLEPESGGEQCFQYEQRVDAMMLDEAIYIRR